MAVDRGRGSQVESMACITKMLLKFSIRVDLSVVTVFPSLSAVGSWEEVVLFSMDFIASQNFFEFVIQDEHFCLKKLALAFVTACVYWFLTSLKSCISRGLFDANAVCHRMILGWSVLSSTFFELGMLI